MATTESHQTAQDRSMRSGQQVDGQKEITHDLVEYFAAYARQNLGYAALCCVGVGFVLGWRLKPR